MMEELLIIKRSKRPPALSFLAALESFPELRTKINELLQQNNKQNFLGRMTQMEDQVETAELK